MEDRQIEIFSDGLTVEYLVEGIIIYRAVNTTRSTVDKWVELSGLHEKQAIAENRHLRRLLDIRRTGYPTPYASAKTIQLANSTLPELRESYAVLTANTISYQFARVVVNRIPQRHIANRVRIFIDEAAAIEWLRQSLTDTEC